MATRQKLIHIHSKIADKAPAKEILSEGEIAVNYFPNKEGLYIKNGNGEIVKFIPEENNTLKTSNKKIVPAINELNDELDKKILFRNW